MGTCSSRSRSVRRIGSRPEGSPLRARRRNGLPSPQGKPQFTDLLCRRAEPFFYAFDILWDEHAWSDDGEETRRFRNGEDTRYLPLSDRKLRLRTMVPKRGERLLYCDHVEGDGEGLFRLACEQDLEGIAAKRKLDSYLPGRTTWLKIRNQNYSQWVGREELFERERSALISQSGMNAFWHVRRRNPRLAMQDSRKSGFETIPATRNRCVKQDFR